MIIVRISGPSVMSFKSLFLNKYGCDVTAIWTGYQRCVEKQDYNEEIQLGKLWLDLA